MNTCISYKLNPQLRILNTDFTLNNCLFGSAKLTKNAGPDKYKYGSCGIGFDFCSQFSFTGEKIAKKCHHFQSLSELICAY